MDDSLINAARAASEQAQNTPETYPVGTMAWVIGLSIWGGVASFCHKLRNLFLRLVITRFIFSNSYYLIYF